MAKMSIQRTVPVNTNVEFALLNEGSDVFVTINGKKYLRLRGNGGGKSGFLTRLRVKQADRVTGVRHLTDGRWAIPLKNKRY